MTRILEVIGRRPQGGIGSFIMNYQSHFNADDVKLDYLIFNDESTGVFDEKVKRMGSNVFVLPELRNSRLLTIWKLINNFFDNNGRNYDAVHLHSVNIAFMIFPAAKRNGIENLLSHSHATVYSDKKINAIRNYFLCKGLKKQATHYLACSLAAGDFLYGKKNRDKVIVLNNAVECDKFMFSKDIRDQYREKLCLEDSFVIGHIGRFNEQKNHRFLIEIFKEIFNENDEAQLLLIGDGPLKSENEKLVDKYGLNKVVRFLGQREDVGKLLMAMDIFILPSLYEGLPVVGIEAQAAGLPCIMSNTITREVNLTDVKFESIKSDPQVWAHRICSIQLNCDKKREEAFSVVASKGYDIKQESEKLYKLYKNLK